jgi:hypothetical protein
MKVIGNSGLELYNTSTPEAQTHIPHPSIEITRKRSMNGFEVS